jgi:Sulfotransferase family
MFNLVFRFLRLMHPSMTRDEAVHIINAPPGMDDTNRNWFKNTPKHHNISKARLQTMLASPKWTKAFFYRDPVSRFISAFRSKCDKFDGDGWWHCNEAFLNGNISFPEALYQMMQPGINQLSTNPHFASYGSFCGGLDHTLDYYDVVQPLNPKTVGSVLKTMFDRVGVDKAITEILIKEVVDSRGRLSTDIARSQERWGLEPDFGVDEKHNTDSGNAFNDYMSSPEAVRIVEDFYASDYALFRSPKTSEEKFCYADS